MPSVVVHGICSQLDHVAALAALKLCFKTCVAMKFVDDDDDDDDVITFFTKHMKVLYSVVLLHCLRLFQNFNV